MQQALTIGFEGLHRSGKGTQMNLLRQYLKTKLIEVISIRGEYYRKGLGNGDFLDPRSSRRQNNWSNNNINFEKSQRINREIRVLFKRGLLSLSQKLGNNHFAVLFDRTIVSRHFLDGLKEENIMLNDVKYIHTKTGDMIEKIIPDIIFIFKCDRNTLLERLALSSDQFSAENFQYKQQIINEYSDKFNEYAQKKLPSELKSKTIMIDAMRNPEKIHKEIIQHLHNYISNYIGH